MNVLTVFVYKGHNTIPMALVVTFLRNVNDITIVCVNSKLGETITLLNMTSLHE